jgi:hypothetical protein
MPKAKRKKEWDEMNSSASFCILLLPLRGRAKESREIPKKSFQ